MAGENEHPNEDEQKALRLLKEAEADRQRAEGKMRQAEEDERRAEEKIQEAVEELEAARDLVTIFVDGIEHRLRQREWIVSELKAKLKIDPAKVLAEITPQGLKDLADNAQITLHENERFMTHARSGGSS
jgi:hypothetical protein